MKSRTARIPIRVVFYRDEIDKSSWVAHCLELDLVGTGATQPEAGAQLAEAILVQLSNTARTGNVKNLFHPAPAEYFAMYAEGKDVGNAEVEIKIVFPPYEIQQADVRVYEAETDTSLAGV